LWRALPARHQAIQLRNDFELSRKAHFDFPILEITKAPSALLTSASGTQPAKFLVLLIKDKGAPALVPAQ
jgi:hypothetical protein